MSGVAPERLFARPAACPQHKRISYFQHSIWVAPPAEPSEKLPLSGTGEYFFLANDSGKDLEDVEIRIAPCRTLWKSYVSNPSGMERSDIRVAAGERQVSIAISRFPADAHFQLTIVVEGLTPNWDRLESANANAILVPLNSRRVGMDAD
ncbi:MAG TPA: hypothetical protein VIT45_10380 [Allosphingosinicella sp.]